MSTGGDDAEAAQQHTDETATEAHGREEQERPSPTALPEGPILVVAAHPDDPDFGCGGSMARLVAEGRQVVVAVFTDGSEGGEDATIPDEVLRDQREGEQRAALHELGVEAVEFLRFPDGRVEPSLTMRRAVTRLIRRYRPSTVFTHDPTAHLFDGYINHPDHRATGLVTLDAIFPAAGNPRAFRDLLAEGLIPHKVQAVYLFYTAQANAWIDISGTPLERKIAGVNRHTSQIGSGDDTERWLRDGAARTGKEGGLEAAEGFRRLILGS